MNEIIRIGMDTSKRIFQLHGVDASERVVLRKKLTRDQMIRYFEQLPPTVVVLEACGSAHHWGRELTRQGHAAKLIAPQLAKPFVKRGKNDAADAEGLLEASSRPSMRYVPAKTVDQQAACRGARAAGAGKHPAGQHGAWLCGGVRADRRQGNGADRTAAGSPAAGSGGA